MAEENPDIPYKTEYAKSNRSSCKSCKCNIGKDSLRVAKMVQSPHFDGKVPNWFHYACFFKKFKAYSLADFAGIDSLRWEDQEKIKGSITGGGGSGAKGPAPAAVATATSTSAEHEYLKAEYAKSSRSSCKHCKEQIKKEELRVAKVIDSGEGYGPAPWWHHIDCFVKARESLDVATTIGAENFTGFKQLTKEDKDMIKKKLGTCGKSSGGGKGKGKTKKVEPPVKVKSDKEVKEEEALKEQSKLIWKIRDGLSSSCPMSLLKEMLEDNDMSSHGGESSVLNRCTDGLAFGKLLPCEECGGGSLVYRDDGYHCTGNISGWTKCMFTTQDPKRGPWLISDEVKEESDFLNSFKFKKRKRLFPKLTATGVAAKSANGSVVAPPGKPLFNLSFAVIGKLKQNKATITAAIQELGGSVIERVNATVSACVSSEAEVKKRSKKMCDAEKHDVPVVSEDFLEAAKKGGASLLMSQHSIAPWGKNKGPSAVDGPPAPVSRKSSASRFELGGSAAKKIKLSVKGGAAVDPDSEMEHCCHVLEVKGVIYNAILGMVDIVRGTNSYYKLQILERDKGSRCYLFRAWGRVGTTIGGNKLEDCDTRQEAISKFRELYAEKTGNEWSNRDNFVKHPNRFYPLEIDYGQDEEDLKKAGITPGSQTKLPIQVQELIKMIFDVESMKKTMVEFEIDLKKMPLGKLTRRQIEKAYSALGEAQQILTNEPGNRNKMLDVSNRFYTLIPHDFGMRKPPMLDNLELIKTKISMLDNLLDIEVAYSLLKSAKGDEEKDPLDVEYEKLKTKLEVVRHESEEFQMIKEYVANTHAATHRQYELEVEDVFKVERHGEAAQYKPFKQLHNRQLLWHGSRKTNYAGILSQGLRIAPPEAPVTGYMFGKGVYFADMVSKSANYCFTSPANNVGLLLLCEVALGNMHELTAANFVTKLPKGKHSVKGLGKTAPDAKETHVMPDGTIVPKGKGVASDLKASSLLYNEYIVYDVSQINIKYLLKTKFNYKYGW